MGKQIHNGVLIIVITLGLFVASDFAIGFAHKTSLAWRNIIVNSEDDIGIGWIARRNFDYRRDLVDAAGRSYSAKIVSDGLRFRRFDRATGRPILIVIGDSFTHAVEVSNGRTYYDVLAEGLGNWNIVAYGAGGYSTLQEALILERRRPELPKSDALLVQLSTNDVINNSYTLESASWLNNNLRPRAYPDAHGEVTLRDPRRWYEYFWLGRQLSARGFIVSAGSIENLIAAGDGDAISLYRNELSKTRAGLLRLRAAFPNVPAFAFLADTEIPIMTDLTALTEEAGFEMVEVIDGLHAQAREVNVWAADGVHWNEAGHRLIGNLLLDRLAPLLERVSGS